MTTVVALTLFVGSLQVSDWLPPSTATMVVEQLVERLGQIELGWTHQRATAAANATVGALARRLQTAGEEQLLKQAPALAELELPSSGDPRLDAMARYQVCVSVYYIRHELRARESSADARIASVMRLTAGSMVMLYLRQRAIDGGQPAERIELFLTGDASERVLERLQRNADTLKTVEAACAPVFAALIRE